MYAANSDRNTQGHFHDLIFGELQKATDQEKPSDTPDELGIIRIKVIRGEGKTEIDDYDFGSKKVVAHRKFNEATLQAYSHETV